MGHALVIGEALVDVVVRPDGSTDRHPGGSPANVAVGLGRLGRDVELLTWIGEDADGTVVRDHLAGSGVRLVAGSGGAPHTSVATAYLN
ncbi:MAG: PfkB family carbohydrate kinase, partial [Micrococcales bacterium]|nr:PfkB family carbohydrate kinase [Micrococcales bacterium]